MSDKLQLIANQLGDLVAMQRMAIYQQTHYANMGDTKHHRLWAEFGYSESLDFFMFHDAYKRHPLAKAAVHRILDETWKDNPWITDGDQLKDTGPSVLANELLERFVMQFKDADRRQMVGRYAGIIVRYADGRMTDQPVDTAAVKRGGINSIVEMVPAWEGQLRVSETDTSILSQNYGKPTMYQYTEGVLHNGDQAPRQFMVHPDRVIIFAEGSSDGSLYSGVPLLEAGFNNLLNLQKVSGAAPESFFKNAARQLVYQLDKEADLEDLAAALGASDIDELPDKINELIKKLNAGFDSGTAVQGGTVTAIEGNVYDPKSTWEINAQEFAGSVGVPMRQLVGSEQGKLAGEQDGNGFSSRCMSRRGWVGSVMMQWINQLVTWGVLDPAKYRVEWSDLLEPSLDDKLAMAERMVKVNETASRAGMGLMFTDDEVREVTGYEPLSAKDKGMPPTVDDDEDAQ